jgi:hypothetical protein
VVGIFALIPGLDVVDAFFIAAGGAAYIKIQHDGVTVYETALALDSLWSDITCAIYDAIEGDGRIDDTNYATILANVGAVTYASSEVHDCVVAFLTNAGSQGLQKSTELAVLTEADCSACGAPWCHVWDFALSDGGFEHWASPYSGAAYYDAGVGWHSGADAYGDQQLVIQNTTPFTPGTITNFEVTYTTVAGAGGGDRYMWTVLSGTRSANHAVPDTTGYHQEGYDPSGLADTVVVDLNSNGSSGEIVITAIQISGTGASPFGTNNC